MDEGTPERTAEAEAVGAEDEAFVAAVLWASDVARRATTLVGAGGLVVALVAEPSGCQGEELGVGRRLGTGLQKRRLPPRRRRRRRHAARRQRQQERRHGHHHHHALIDKSTASHGAATT